MRQLRSKPDSCRVPESLRQTISECQADYSMLNEEQRSFEPGWTINQTTAIYSSTIRQAFQYQLGDELNAYVNVGEHATYSRSGYVYAFRGRLSDLRSNLSQLHQLQWIDGQTRAVIIQMSLYNSNVQMFTSVTFLVEFLSTSGAWPQAHFQPLNLEGASLNLQHSDFHLSHLGFTSIFHVLCAISYMAFIVYFMTIEVRSIFHFKFGYFQQIWPWIQLSIIGCSWTGVGVYVWRYHESARIISLFQKTNGYAYINLQLAAYINELFIYLQGFCCFFGSLQFLRFCRFNRRLSLFTETLQHAGKDLLAFTFMFSIVFIAFLGLFHLLFVSNIWTCSTLLLTAQMLVEMTSLKYNVNELCKAAPFLGPFCFSLFIVLVVFICMNMFISIVSDSFRTVRQHAHNDNNEIFTFILYKFQRWTGKRVDVLVPHDANIMDVQVGVNRARRNCTRSAMHECAPNTTIPSNVFRIKSINYWKHSTE